MDRHCIRLVTLGLTLLAAACGTTPDTDGVYEGPEVDAAVEHFAGTPVSSPRTSSSGSRRVTRYPAVVGRT